MKLKFILSAVCLTVAMTAAAQGQQRRGGMRGNMDAVVDTAIINQMKLPADITARVVELQKAKQTEMRDMMQRQARPEKGQRLSDEQRKQFMQQRREFTAQYRRDLRNILGDDNYITYLELQLDRRQQPGAGQPGQNRNVQQQRQQMQREMQQQWND